jgi:hypothetical protein
MYKALGKIHAHLAARLLPAKIAISLNPDTNANVVQAPTHLLAVYLTASGAITLYPIHTLFLAVHCAHVPVLVHEALSSGTIPIQNVCLPDGSAFPVLLHYFYHRRSDELIRSLLLPVKGDRRAAAARVHGLWRDACALGVCDVKFWDALDLAWTKVVGV